MENSIYLWFVPLNNSLDWYFNLFIYNKIVSKPMGNDDKINVYSICWFTISLRNSPVLHSARHQRPARERHKIRIASRETVDNQAPRNTNFTH